MHVCGWVHVYMHVRLCGGQTTALSIVTQPLSTWGYLRHCLSLTQNSASRLDWLASMPQIFTFLYHPTPTALWLQVCFHTQNLLCGS